MSKRGISLKKFELLFELLAEWLKLIQFKRIDRADYEFNHRSIIGVSLKLPKKRYMMEKNK